MTGKEEIGKHRSRWRSWAIGFGVWTIVGLSFGTRSYLQAQFSGTPVTVPETVFSYMTDFYMWGLVSPFIFWLCKRFPIERRAVLKRLLFYAVVGIILVLVVTAITLPVTWYLRLANRVFNPSLGVYFDRLMFNPFMLHQGLLAYCGTVAVAHAYEYYRQVQISRIRTSELSAQLAQAQLAALKMQIHPHFLFNTLNSISALLHKDVELADRMIARLSEFLRATLKNSDVPVVTLRQEIEFLRTYLEIEKVRFQDGLVVDIDIEPEALDARVPNLILQPLVENAVRHGIGRSTSIGRLYINARSEVDRLLIKIEDNGPGLNGNENGNRQRKQGSGLGLANTRARLERFYGDDFSFEITGRSDSTGATVSLNLPFLAMAASSKISNDN